MDKYLIVEDTNYFGSVCQKKLSVETGVKVEWVKSFAETKEILENSEDNFLLAFLDIHLPDAEGLEVVEYVKSRNIPSVVVSGEYSDTVRDGAWDLQVVDYIIKDSSTLERMVALAKRIHNNHSVKVLLVDDSAFDRFYIGELLRIRSYNVLEAEDGLAALQILEENPDIKLVLADYSMPGMDGFELIRKIRRKYDRSKLAIIGISAQGSNKMSAWFVKHGANDFLNKPFLTEEFYCRVSQNIEMIEHIETIREIAIKDFLTGLYNARYFFEAASGILADSRCAGKPVTVAMLDIDFFKKINDSYGHDGGDIVLKRVSTIIKDRFRHADIVARVGGEEFCVLETNMSPELSVALFDALREKIAAESINIGDNEVNVTISIGLCVDPVIDDIDQLVKKADEALYEAKNNGRNKVVLL